MTEWLKLSSEERLETLKQASAESGISIKAIEKDWWVTLVLKAIFQSKYADHLLFKGGTSLSKCWKLIDRFSEDIDLALDRGYFGEVEDWTHSQVKRLKKKGCAFTSVDLKEAIWEELIKLGVPEGMITITAGEVKDSMPDKDPQDLSITYHTVTEPVEYVADSVKVEVSARSLKEPWSNCDIESILDEYLPKDLKGGSFQVPAVEPKRTFLEKIFLLHEEFQKAPADIRHFRMSRHLYDLDRLMTTAHAKQALADDQLYKTIIEHREKFVFLP
ncbi:MAG: nucleotidyl transferase AbiEii/AbiGii toxin family protein, partial [Pedobacter sp.]